MLPEVNAHKSLGPSMNIYFSKHQKSISNAQTVYLDNNATTFMAPEVSKVYQFQFGNPSSLHTIGRKAFSELSKARSLIKQTLNADGNIIFTSGATESNTLAIKGILEAQPQKKHLITTAVEHLSIIKNFNDLAKRGYEISYIPISSDGVIDLDDLSNTIRSDTALVSVMHANNETGVVFPIADIVRIVKNKGVYIHVDAAQTFGKIPIDLSQIPIDLMSISAHKLHGPKGVGGLFIKNGISISPIIYGGNQEMGIRAGTENVPGAVGFGIASNLAFRNIDENYTYMKNLRDMLEKNIKKLYPHVDIIGFSQNRLPSTSCIAFKDIDGRVLLQLLDKYGIFASAGSACCSHLDKTSHVLDGMGIDPNTARSVVRFSLSRFTTSSEIQHVISTLSRILLRYGNALKPNSKPDKECSACNAIKSLEAPNE
ncbi:MAG: cysteine desulfurase family protein [Bacillota bacterium]|nr:cysteine desulfurase family protein [Bacillota bacterium]